MIVVLALASVVVGLYLGAFKLWRFLGIVEGDFGPVPRCRVCARPSASEDVCPSCADGVDFKGGDYVNRGG